MAKARDNVLCLQGGVEEDLANEVCHFAAHYTDKVHSNSVAEEHEESTVSDEEVTPDPDGTWM